MPILLYMLLLLQKKRLVMVNFDEGLWSQAFFKAKGDESLRKLEYIKLRVRYLKKHGANNG